MNILAEVSRLIAERHRETHLLATVDSVSGGSISIIRDGQTAPDATPYAAANGLAAAVAPGDRVAVTDYTGKGGFVVVAKVVT